MAQEIFKSEEEYVSQAGTGALLNPRVDSTFKALFTQKTEDSYEAMRSFLSAATERTVTSWRLTANDAPTSFSGQRDVSYDISCEFDDGKAAASLREANDLLLCRRSRGQTDLRACA